MPIPPVALALLAAWQELPASAAQEEQAKRVERTFIERERKTPLFAELVLADPDPKTPLLALFHGADSSLGEYRPIVPHLRALGYNCLSVDLSYGGECREIRNRTIRVARLTGRKPTYLDCLPEMTDALEWARSQHAHGKVLAWGSGFTASLALVLAGERPDLVDAVVAFSPGEFFIALGKGETWVQESARQVTCPVFASSAESEAEDWKAIFTALASTRKTAHLSHGPSAHGSRALWEESAGSGECWTALESFLRTHLPVPSSGAPKKNG